MSHSVSIYWKCRESQRVHLLEVPCVTACLNMSTGHLQDITCLKDSWTLAALLFRSSSIVAFSVANFWKGNTCYAKKGDRGTHFQLHSQHTKYANRSRDESDVDVCESSFMSSYDSGYETLAHKNTLILFFIYIFALAFPIIRISNATILLWDLLRKNNNNNNR